MWSIVLCAALIPAEIVSHNMPQPQIRTGDYISNSVVGAVGGLCGFAVTYYATAAIMEFTSVDDSYFELETAAFFGYMFGMTLGTAYALDNNPLRTDGVKGSYRTCLKYSFIGVQIGLAALLVGSNINEPVKFYTFLAIAPVPLISGVIGYNKSMVPIQPEIRLNHDSMLDHQGYKFSCRLFKWYLK